MSDRAVDNRLETIPPKENPTGVQTTIDVVGLIAALRRQKMVVVIATCSVLLLGAVYCVSAVPRYTATNEIIIDSHKNLSDLTASLADATLDTAAIDSQVEVIKSDNVAALVSQELQLDQNELFLNGGGLLSAVRSTISHIVNFGSWFVSPSVNEEERRQAVREAIIAKLESNLEVKRVARTYILTVSYTSPNPKLSVDIANAYADAYFTDQLNARYEQVKRASGWLRDRLTELKSSSIQADMAIQQFKAKHGLVSSGDGKFIGDQQVTELTSQLSAAHDQTANAEARLKQITDIIQSGRTDVAVTDQLGSAVINDLRTKYLKAAKTAQELTSKLGPTHYQVVSLHKDMDEYQRLIFVELKRIAMTYTSDLEVARTREKTLNDSMNTLAGEQTSSNEVMVQLRQLIRESDSYQNLYTTFLQRYQDALQQQSFPTTEARTITSATLPSKPSWPNIPFVMVWSGLVGLMLGGSLAAWREYNDQGFRTPDQVREVTGLHFIGMLEKLPSKKNEPEQAESPDARHVLIREPIMRHVLEMPLSGFAETLRSAKVEVDLQINAGRKVIGIVSVMPGEGKTTTAKNLASLIALQGARVLLIDADFRNPGMTRRMAPHVTAGLIEVLRRERPLEELLLREPESGLLFLPSVTKKRILDSQVLLASNEMEKLLEEAAANFDYVIVDLPPLGPVIDVRGISRFFNAFVFVVEWGTTPRRVVRRVLEENRDIYEKTVGLIFNSVISARMRKYNYGESRGYYYGKYAYYYTDSGTGKERAGGKKTRL
ncbi:AAA family ATPase [Agrobacterium larrymoorei]|uniref:non-specific protein-tyrosine kinase n=1 Tax=Agrobacterium larrymoorei TaxID=160699 RepID=A0ABU0UGS1_9HYPH|nr:AAA family ATPase [Agrobacterium larrymoorei]MDQ1184124.1 succinoglycan biosynthesis transport protein ExoP [Agrobacterium larrymoorei]